MKKIIIIGAGISGLSAGIYGQKNGFNTKIFEKHSIAGGECTGWNRKGFNIDGCIHWLLGTKENTKLNQLWKEIGALDNIKVYQPNLITTVEKNGSFFEFPNDLDLMRKKMLEMSYEDKDLIEELCEYIKAYYDFEPPVDKPFDLMNIPEIIALMKKMKSVGKVMNKINKYTVKEYSENFKNPIIKEALLSVVPYYYSASILIFSLAAMMSGNGGKPEKGSLHFSKRIEEKYKSLGGEIFFNKEVKEIIIENKKAVGIKLNDDTIVKGDYIIPACDINHLFKTLLKDNYSLSKFDKMFNNPNSYPLQSCIYISYSVDYNLKNYPYSYIFNTKNLKFEDNFLDTLSFKNYSYDPYFSPENKSIIIVYIKADYDWWNSLYKDKVKYNKEKKKLAEEIKFRIEDQFKELKDKIQVLDIATPKTYERYCNAYKGSWMSFGETPKGKQYIHNGKIKKINKLYISGQWLMSSGGLPAAALTGKWAIQRILKDTKKR